MLDLAEVLAQRALCRKRQVGCVLTDDRSRIIGTGYNGRPRGLPNCNALAGCEGNHCEGVHAEINALLQAGGKNVHACYTTCAPCWHCVKALVNTDCQLLVFRDASTWEQRSENLWRSLDRRWIHYLG